MTTALPIITEALVRNMKHNLLALALFVAVPLSGAPDVQKLMQETQQFSQDGSEMILVWWIPTEFWGLSLRDAPGMTDEQKKQFVEVLGGYTVVSVIACDVGPFGGLTPRGRSAILESAKLTVGDRIVAPVGAREISADAMNFLLMIKPALASMLGQFGEGIEFFLYPNDGEFEIRAEQTGAFSYEVFGKRFDWRLPLGALLTPKVDPATGEKFPGNYLYNPFTGAKLSDK